jgi:hypothetical protein
MIRQAHTYLVGAMGGATLIAIAIAVFVVLVSAQVVKDWPLAGLGGGSDDAAVSEAQPAGSAVDAGAGSTVKAGATAAGAGAGKATRDGANRAGGLTATGGAVATNDGNGENATEPGGGDQAGNPGGSPQATNAPGSGGGGATSSGGGAAGGGGKTGSGGQAGGGGSSTSGQVTSTVNNTVNQVDESALGGTLGQTGVTDVTEGVVNGVAGPESVVGNVVDEAVGAVGGILGKNP